jgi:hypothetical protein
MLLFDDLLAVVEARAQSSSALKVRNLPLHQVPYAMCKKLLLALCVAAAAAFGAQPHTRPLTRLFASRASFPRLAPLSSTSKRFSPIARGAPLRAEPLSEIPTEMGEWVAARVRNDVTRSRIRGSAVALQRCPQDPAKYSDEEMLSELNGQLREAIAAKDKELQRTLARKMEMLEEAKLTPGMFDMSPLPEGELR